MVDESGTDATDDQGAATRRSALGRRQLLLGAGAVAGAGAAILAAPDAVLGTAAATDAAASVGTGPGGTTVAEFVAVIDQNAGALVSYGYLTRLAGLAPSALFSDPAHPSEATALYTATAAGTLSARSTHDAVTVLDVNGTMTFFRRTSPGADFDNPASFKVGRVVAGFRVVMQDVLTVIAPNTGIPTLAGDMTQTQAAGVGRVGQRLRLSATGLGRRSDAVAPKARLTISGNLVAV